MANIVGVDAGLTLTKPTSGICRTGTSGFSVGHTYLDKLSRTQALSPTVHIDCLGIDAPVLPKNLLHYDRRLVESLFMRGDFQTRCKPGASHVPGNGQALRRSGCDTAVQFATETQTKDSSSYPRVQTGQSIVEAFPNAFLGVMLDQRVIDEVLIDRGEKTDRFFSLCNARGAFKALEQHLDWKDAAFWAAFETTTHHDDLAALVCAATAICAHSGKYVAAGDVLGGYFFLPPWPLWKPWARAALDSARKERDLCDIVIVINDLVFGARDRLP